MVQYINIKSKRLQTLEMNITNAMDEIAIIILNKSLAKEPAELEQIEEKIFAATDKLGSAILAKKFQLSLNSQQIKEESNQLVQNFQKKMKDQGIREAKIQPSRGEAFTVECPYFSTGRKKWAKKNGKGFRPGFILLGIHDRCTPCLASEVSFLTVMCCSLTEAQTVLKNRGLEMDTKKIKDISFRFGQRAKLALQNKTESFKDTVAGRRVVISTDGGRIRIRKNKRGSKTKKGRTRYRTDWREPKLLIIYVVNENGEMDRSFSSFIDGTLQGPDAVFALIKFYLSKLNIDQAYKILFVADGALWIWKRINNLKASLGLKSSQFYELVDFYHAVEYLGKAADLCKKWTSKERKKWIRKNRGLLLKGKVEQVVNAVKEICRGRNSKKFTRIRNYFAKNIRRMAYSEIFDLGLPIGSGAMESAIRRVVNLRLKGPAIYWLQETAENMLLLRSFYKAGRWNMLKNMAVAPILPALA